MIAVVGRLKASLDGATDNKGVQYKINIQPKWKGTIGLRCNHIFFESVTHYIDQVGEELAAQQAFPLLEHISVSKAFDTDPMTNRKRSVPWKRTIFVTLRPGKEFYDLMAKSLPSAVENYMPLDTLLEYLGGLK
jgi:hypothetical protein